MKLDRDVIKIATLLYIILTLLINTVIGLVALFNPDKLSLFHVGVQLLFPFAMWILIIIVGLILSNIEIE